MRSGVATRAPVTLSVHSRFCSVKLKTVDWLTSETKERFFGRKSYGLQDFGICIKSAHAQRIMGQEQSYPSHASVTSSKRYKDSKYEDPIQYRSSPIDYRPTEYEDKDYKRHKVRRSADSFKSDNSSTESSGYRSGSSAYECRSDRSSKSEYYCTSLYKNDHYKDVNKELYKPVKIPKEKRYKLQLFDEKEDLKCERLKSYLSDTDKAKVPVPKKAGIRNYTPKILEEEQRKIENWI